MATILFFYGDDTYRSGQKVRALKQRYIDQSLGDTNLTVLDGGAVTFDELVRQVQALPFLAKTRLVVIRDLLGRAKKALLEQVPAYLDRVPATTVLVVHEAGRPDQRTKLFKRLNQPRAAERFDLLTGLALERWVASQASGLGLTLTTGLTRQLVERVGSNLARMDQELQKLALWQHGSPAAPLTTAVMEDLVPSETAGDIFQLIDALARRDGAQALRELAALLEQGEAELYILTMIVYQYRQLLLVTEARERGIRTTGLARALHLAPFVAEKLARIAPRYRFAELAGQYERLLDYDVAIKTGALEPCLALELLIGEFASAPAR